MSEGNLSVAANSVSTNRLAGLLHEFLDRAAMVTLAAAAAAVGINVTFLIGGQSVVQDQSVSQANRFPIFPDDAVTQEQGIGRMILQFRNTTGAAIIVNWSLDVDYLV
jgi:hypothetical protein